MLNVERKNFLAINDGCILYDPKIEEEDVHEECECDMAENPFVEEPEGAEGKAVTGGNSVEESSKTEEATSGGEESFVWGDEDD